MPKTYAGVRKEYSTNDSGKLDVHGQKNKITAVHITLSHGGIVMSPDFWRLMQVECVALDLEVQ